jgi:hypothetical protein
VSQNEYDTAIAEFIRTKGTTRCPTACTYPTDGTVSATDRAALEALRWNANGRAGVKLRHTRNHFGPSG